MEVDPGEYSGQVILTTGGWEPQVLAVLTTVLTEGSVFADVGAHVGYYSLQAGRIVGPSGSVIAIEPNPPIADKLRRNIKLNPFTNIKVHQVACTDKTTRLRFFPSTEEFSMWSSLSPNNSGGEQAIEVAGLPLDAIAEREKLPSIALVKVDVEGAEMQVLLGMKRILSTFRPKLILELKADALANLGSSMEEVLSLLDGYGYKREQTLSIQDSLWTPDPLWKGTRADAAP